MVIMGDELVQVKADPAALSQIAGYGTTLERQGVEHSSGGATVQISDHQEDNDAGYDSDAHDHGAKKNGQNGRSRKPHLQGRFSGRLETKTDEKRLVEECKKLGPLLGGTGKRGEKSRMTLAKIVRGIASGEVRQHCEERERQLMVRMIIG